MSIPRETIESVFARLWELTEKGDFDNWVNLFSEDCIFANPMLPEPICDREALRELTRMWPPVENVVEWSAIDRDRLVVGWRERRAGPQSGAWYRGFSSFVFDETGLISSYEAMFDSAAIIRAASS